MGLLLPSHPLTNFEIQKYYQNEPIFNGLYSRINLPKKVRDGAYVIKLNEYVDVGTDWIAFFVTEMKLFILVVLVLDMFLKRLKNLFGIRT